MSKSLEQDGLYFIPLGGSEEFGINLNVYVCDGRYLLVDCGIGFADERFPGIDILLPDPVFLDGCKDKIAALIITHAHEDHVGAVAHLWQRFGCPIYTTRFTDIVLARKLEEQGIKNAPVEVIDPFAHLNIDPFKVQFVPVAHSIPDTSALIIETPYGQVVHSGDWNMDPRPVIGAKTQAEAFKAAASSGVLAYVGDSTNAQVPGRAGSEGEIQAGLEAEFKKCEGKIAVTMFASNVGRIISICRAAKKTGREVGVIGRSLHRMIAAAHECGFMDGIPAFVDEDDLGFIPDDKMVVIVTGSQGESRAALARIARGDHRSISFKRGDTVIFSSRAIPGNDRSINAVKNNLSAGGVRVVTQSDTDSLIHVSGHPCRDEVADMFSWIKPDLVVPVHGERAQLEAHAQLAKECQIKHAIVPVNGAVIKIAPGEPDIIGHVEVGILAVDQKRIIKSDHQSIVGRRKLQYTGAVHISVVVDIDGAVLGALKLDTVGLIDENSAETQIENNIEDEILDIIDDMSDEERRDDDYIAEQLRIGTRRLVFDILGVKPKTTVHVLRV